MNKLKSRLNSVWFYLFIFFIGLVLRGNITSLSSVKKLIGVHYQLNSVSLAYLTSIPLVVFAIFSPLMIKLNKIISFKSSITLALVFVALGNLMKMETSWIMLLVGTTIMSIGICVGNVNIPVLIKKVDINRNLAIGVYTAGLNLWAGLGVYLSGIIMGNYAFERINRVHFFYFLVALGMIFCWVIILSSVKEMDYYERDSCKILINRSKSMKMERLLYLHFGLQSLLFYSITMWFYTILLSKGFSHERASIYSVLLQVMSIPSALLCPIFLKKNWKISIILIPVLYCAGIILLLFELYILLNIATVLIGVGMGNGISLSISFINNKGEDVSETLKLSSYSQMYGYALAASGPIALGYMNDIFGDFRIAIIFLFTVSILFFLVGRALFDA